MKRKMTSTFLWIKHCLLCNSSCFTPAYPLSCELSGVTLQLRIFQTLTETKFIDHKFLQLTLASIIMVKTMMMILILTLILQALLI